VEGLYCARRVDVPDLSVPLHRPFVADLTWCAFHCSRSNGAHVFPSRTLLAIASSLTLSRLVAHLVPLSPLILDLLVRINSNEPATRLSGSESSLWHGPAQVQPVVVVHRAWLLVRLDLAQGVPEPSHLARVRITSSRSTSSSSTTPPCPSTLATLAVAPFSTARPARRSASAASPP
jgi:hypothetical protein